MITETELKFRGMREKRGCVVLVSHDGGQSYANLPLYLEWVNHSPTGFEWGYYGSGPSQLAYAILHHYFTVIEGLDDKDAHEKAQDIYMRFKQDVIGIIHSEKLEIDGLDITAWLKRIEKARERLLDK